MRNRVKVILLVFGLMSLWGVASATVTVAAATGGGSIDSYTAQVCSFADKWTTLSGPTIEEGSDQDIGMGTIVLSAPSGFEFNTAASVTILLTGDSNNNKNINNSDTGSSLAASVTASAITFTVVAVSKNPKINNKLTWQGVQVRPIAATPLANGKITHTGTSVINGLDSTTNLGTLTEVTSTPPCIAAPRLTKVASTSAAVVNDVVTFNITAANPYGVDMSAITVSDVLPSGMNYVTYATTLGSVANAGQTVTWTIPTLIAGTSAQLTLAVRLTLQGTLSNTVTSPGSTSASANVLVLANAVTRYTMDQPVGSWKGAAGEVIDSGGTALHGTRVTTSTPTATNLVNPNPSIASQNASVVGGFCNAASFDGNAVVQVPHDPKNNLFDYKTKLSASAWIYPTAWPSELMAILSNDQNYEFHLNPSGNLYWWWGASNFTSKKSVSPGQWTHIAITFDSTAGRQLIYINGVQDKNTNNWKGTLSSNPCPFYIGGDIATDGNCTLIPARNFRGMIDEVKLYNYELSAAEVQADMTLGRNCSGTYDHIQIEHDGAGSVCTPDTVTVKVCLNAACTTLYTGDVTVQMSPTGWVGGDTFVIHNGVGTASLSNSTAGNVTLGTVSATPNAVGATRCFKGGAETCTMNFASASCAFDAVEPAAGPKTHLYTKLAGTAFNVDLLALMGSSAINTTYTGTVAVDLVDSSSAACPSSSGLNAVTSIAFVVGDKGRKQVSFTSTQAAANVRVRMKAGSSAAACSTDNFAIRPPQFTVSSSNANADNAGLSTSVVMPLPITAGAIFGLAANSVVGYGGTPFVDITKVAPHAGAAQVGTLAGTFGAAAVATGSATGSSFTYGEVGYFRLIADGAVDTTFTGVDSAVGDCVVGSSSNTANASGKFGCTIGSAVSNYFGRFIPDHFETVLTQACSTFTYSGQPFNPLRVSAYKSGGTSGTGITKNYASGYSKALTFTDANAVVGGSFSSTSLAAGSFTLGEYADSTSLYLFSPANHSPATIKLRAAESTGGDGVTSSASVEGTTEIRSGRVRMQNAYGSERLALPVPLLLQYWNGSWQNNAADKCTSIASSQFAWAFPVGTTARPNNLAACKSALTVSGTAPNYTVNLSAPGAGNTGWTDLTLNLGAADAGTQCVAVGGSGGTAKAANEPWLRGGGSTDPTARATFGIFKSPLIYRRENY